jgi:hypothetical protein
MSRLETSVTQVNAAVRYLIEKNASFTKPFQEINVFILKKMNLKPKELLG